MQWINGPHATYIIASYSIASVVIAALVLVPWLRLRKLRRSAQLASQFGSSVTNNTTEQQST